jgi:hypothetical protein
MNIFDTVKRKISNTWREQSSTEVIDLSDDSDSEVSQQSQSSSSTHRRSTSSEQSSSSLREISGHVDHSGRSSFVSAASLTPSSSTSTPKYGGRKMTLANAMQKYQTIPATPESSEAESSPEPQVVTAAPKFKPSPPVQQILPKPSSSLIPIGVNSARQSNSPVYSQKQQDAAKYRATLTEKIFAKKEQLRKLEVLTKIPTVLICIKDIFLQRFLTNDTLIQNLPDKGVRIRTQIEGLRLELRPLYKSLKELGEIPPLKEVKKETNVPADKLTPFEQLPVKKNYQRPGGIF